MKYKPYFPDLYRNWLGHDLATYRPNIYQGLHQENEIVVWEFIEQQYLLRFSQFILVAFEWGAEGLWGIPFPGSVGMGEYLSPTDIDMPQELVSKIDSWHAQREIGSRPWEKNDLFDYDSSDARGVSVAKKVKSFLGADYYVEYHRFRELKIIDGKVIETPVPEIIREAHNHRWTATNTR